MHIVSSQKFLRTSSSPHKTLPNDKYDAPKEVCGERKLFYCPPKKLDRVGPVDNRPSTNKLHHFVRQEEEEKIIEK